MQALTRRPLCRHGSNHAGYRRFHDRVGTSISRIYINLSKGSNASKAQKEMWEELGFTAEGIAKSMQTDGVGTLREVFTALQDMPDERKVAALSTLFGQWAIEGRRKITNNLGAYEGAWKW